MLHDIGFLVLDRFSAPEFEKALQISMAQHTTIQDAEHEVFGFDHANVGGLLAKKWNLSEEITAAVSHHHNPEQEIEHSEFTNVISIADILIARAGITSTPGSSAPELDERLLESVGIPLEQCDPIVEVAKQEIQRAEAIFKVA